MEFMLRLVGTVFAVILLPPLLQGWIKLLKARMQGRQGPRLVQPYADLRKLARKEAVLSTDATWITTAAPYAAASFSVLAAAMVPVMHLRSPLDFAGDVFVLFYLLAAGRFITVLAALDTGSNFGGMGASRELAVSTIVEPALFLSLLPAIIANRSTELSVLSAGHPVYSAAQAISAAAFFFVLLAETGRIPVDNPDTHLELTMIHEGMILDYSGRYLALMQASEWIKQWVFVSIGANLFLPDPPGWPGWLAFPVKIIVIGGLMAVAETFNAKMRMYRIPRFIGTSILLSLLAAGIALWG